jgi:phosphoadenosine phosphosulfate reductase
VDSKPRVVRRMEREMKSFIKKTFSLQDKIIKSQQVIRKAMRKYGRRKTAIAFTGGKDSLVMLHLIKSVYAKIPLVVYFGDTGQHFPEVYSFIDKTVKEWKIKLVIGKPKISYQEVKGDRLRCCHALKTLPQQEAIRKYHWRAVMVAIRRDEQKTREREQYFSLRKDPDHVRVHPLLHWTEKDVWDFIKLNKLPVNPLYKRGYRSLGCRPCTRKTGGVYGDGKERSGRSQDKEKIMARLRQLGYW